MGLVRVEDSEEMLPEETISSIAKYTAKEYSGDNVKAAYDD